MIKENLTRGAALTLPLAAAFEAQAQNTITDVARKLSTEISDEPASEQTEESHSLGLITDLAWILLLGALVTLIFKKLKQPVVLGYILAGFIASPKFIYLPSISNLDNIDFWAELGIVVLMFCLGLEFSFKKLLNSGSSAIVTALIIITGMTMAGFGVGVLLHLNAINCIFLGGMISMSSTTIILKSLGDLGLKQKKFATLVLSVLIIEDLFAVLMLVLLSSIAMGDVQGMELVLSIAKLAFFLIIWIVVGTYLLPSFLNKVRAYLNNETLLVVSMGLCFTMAIFSVMCGFSMELGAFVMGSILAGTVIAERIEHVMLPVKDLFGSVFFISVGMMVDPLVLANYWSEILLLAVVVIAGMIIFGTLGMLVTGQSLKVAMESGFTLTQIGEFSFIIASLGMSLGVLEANLYPIIVAVSVITIFTTPYFIKMAIPAYNLVAPRLPQGLHFLIDRYSKQTSDSSETKRLWRDILSRYVWRILLYSVILTAIILCSQQFLFPIVTGILPHWGKIIATVLTLIAMSPFLAALSFSSTKPDEKMKLHASASFYDVPLVAMRIVRYLVALLFVVYFIGSTYGSTRGWIVGVGCFIIIVGLASTRLLQRYKKMEDRFMDNLNIRENMRSGRNNNLIDDLHQAYIQVGPNSIFVGDRLKDSGLRHDYGVSISSIQRGMHIIPLPTGDTRIFPGDILGVIGTDDQIKSLNDDIERDEKNFSENCGDSVPVELKSLRLTANSPIINKPLSQTDLRSDYGAMIVKVVRDNEYLNPTPDMILTPADTIWIVGDPTRLPRMR